MPLMDSSGSVTMGILPNSNRWAVDVEEDRSLKMEDSLRFHWTMKN